MTVRDMHFDFKMKLNKVDSQQNANLRVPEIDWKLNEAQEVFIKSIAKPRSSTILGFEKTKRIKDDIKEIVKKQFFDDGQCILVTKIDDYTYQATLPTDYMFYNSARAVATKGTCQAQLVVHFPEDDELTQESPFDDPSFEWRETNAFFHENGLLVKTDGTFEITHLCLTYIRKPLYIHNAQDFGGSYLLPDGVTLLTGFQNCELSTHAHKEIVDIAVALTQNPTASKEVS